MAGDVLRVPVSMLSTIAIKSLSIQHRDAFLALVDERDRRERNARERLHRLLACLDFIGPQANSPHTEEYRPT